MTEKELHKLRRQDFLQLLLTQGTEMAELQKRLEDTTEALQQTEAMGERLKLKLNEKDELIEKLKGRLDQKDAAISEMESEMEAARESREMELEAAEAAVATELQGRLDETTEARDQAEAMGERLKVKLNEKDASIERLKTKLNEKDALIEKLKGRLDKKDATINRLEAEVVSAREDSGLSMDEAMAVLRYLQNMYRQIQQSGGNLPAMAVPSAQKAVEPLAQVPKPAKKPVQKTKPVQKYQSAPSAQPKPVRAKQPQPAPSAKPKLKLVVNSEPAPAGKRKAAPAADVQSQQTDATQPRSEILIKTLYRRSHA